MDGLAFQQKRNGVRLRYEFGEDSLAYANSDATGAAESRIPSEAIDLKHTIIFSKPMLTPLIGFCAGAGFALMGFAFLLPREGASAAAMAWVLWTAFCFMLFAAAGIRRGRGVKFTIFQTSMKQPIRVLHGKHHDAIVEELTRRRVAKLRRLYARIELGNDPHREAAKFTWLRDEKVIDEQEYQKAVSAIRQAVAEDTASDRLLS